MPLVDVPLIHFGSRASRDKDNGLLAIMREIKNKNEIRNKVTQFTVLILMRGSSGVKEWSIWSIWSIMGMCIINGEFRSNISHKMRSCIKIFFLIYLTRLSPQCYRSFCQDKLTPHLVCNRVRNIMKRSRRNYFIIANDLHFDTLGLCSRSL